MAEEGRVYELEGLEEQLHTLLSRYSGDELGADGGPFCSDFCKLVEEFASRWQVPLPQLRILEIALCYFARASIFCTSNCDHVLHTLSSLALSVFELLLFFNQKDFHQEPLKHFTVTFQECHVALAKHENVHLLQVERLVRGGGPWANPALQAILSESSLPQNEVDGCIGSELPVFFELRVRYLLSCKRTSEAVALAQCCARHPTAGQHSFFLQVYLTWLYKTSQHDRLVQEVADLSGKDAVHLICSLECEEKDELLLGLSTAFLLQQLRRGDMYYLCELVFVWTKLHSRLKTSKQALLKESHQLMLSATNVNSLFPFIRAILQEVGEDGVQFCVELCANALDSCLPCDILTKSLIYKTIAGLLPNDLEVCRACALLVFFLERTVESYKVVYLLYMHPDQEYHVEHSPIGNHVRFETLQVLKKDLYFDPEFWNLIALRTNCLKLMSEKVVSAALEEIMDDKWISNYFAKKPALRSRASVCQRGSKSALQGKKRHGKEDTDTAGKRLKVGSGNTGLNVDHAVKKKGSRPLKEASSGPLRRSFWQLDRIQDSGEHRRTTRLSEKNPPKRRIRRPKWLLEDSGTLEENNSPLRMKKHGLKHEKHHQSSVMRRSEASQIKNKHKPSVNSHLKAKENDNNKHHKGSLDCNKPSPSAQVILELSLPDNELLGTFTEDACNRHRGFPQVLLYKPTVKIPAASQPVKTVHRKEVVLRARDAAMFVQQLHCYARRQKGKGNGSNVQNSVSTITRSSMQGSPPKDPPREEMKGGIVLRPTTVAARDAESPVIDKVLQTETKKMVTRKTSSARELPEKSAAQMKVTAASQRSAAAKLTKSPLLTKNHQAQSTKVTAGSDEARVTNGDEVLQSQTVASAGAHCEEPAVEMKVTIASQSQVLDKVSKHPSVEDVAKADATQTSTADKNQKKPTDKIPLISNKAGISSSGAIDPAVSQSPGATLRGVEQAQRGRNPLPVSNSISEMEVTTSEGHVPCKNDTSPRRNIAAQSKVSENEAPYTPVDQGGMSDISALTLVTEMVTELAPEQLSRDLENDKQQAPGSSASKDSRVRSKPKVPHRTRTTSSCSAQGQEAADVQRKKVKDRNQVIDSDTPENSESMETAPESEESKLEYCCTFCNKEFKGSRVVAHAMFHYRKDECMFCGTIFKDDLLAMMHLSDHIEKLKRIKESTDNQAQENGISDAKDISTPKTSAKAKTSSMSSGCRSRGRPKKSDVCPKSGPLPDSSPFESRKLRSKDKPVEGSSLQETQNSSKHLNSTTAVHKVNGHIGKKKELDRSKKDSQHEASQGKASGGAVNPRLQEKIEINSSAASVQGNKKFASSTEEKIKETESLQALKATTKQNGKVAEEKNMEPQEKVSCPADGCSWFTDLTKNRVALLYHALEDHYGEVKPLELAFHVGNSRCSICMRVLWSFQHFQHHVERHRLAPRHPCLHQGCTSRFKSGMEMRRHARKHSPLQAVCCLPGCSKLFICLWALNLHEREHYASKSTKPDTNANVQTSDKHITRPFGKKHHQSLNETRTATAVNKTESVKAAWKSRERTTHDLQGGKHPKAPPLSTPASLIKQELKERNKSKDSNVLKNLSNKDTSAKPTGPHLRLRQTLRKEQATNTTVAPPKIHSVISSSLLKHSSKLRQKFKKQVKVNIKGLKRRGRPPKCNKAVDDENTTETVKEKTTPQKSQKSPVQSSPTETVENATASNRLKVEEKSRQLQGVAKTATDKSKSKNSASKQIKRNHVKQKGISHDAPSNSLKQSNSEPKTQKLNAVKVKKLHKNETPSAPSDSSKSEKHKMASSKVNKKTTKKINLEQEADVPSTATSKSAVQQVEGKGEAVESSADGEGKVKVENTDSTQNNSGTSEFSVPADSLNVPAATEKMDSVKKEENSKKLHVTEKGKNASSDSGMARKKHKDALKKWDRKSVKEKRPCKGEGKASASKKREKSDVQQQSETKGAAALGKETLNEDGKGQKETSDNSGSSMPAVTNTINDNPENSTEKAAKKKKSQKTNVTLKTDQSKANKKRKHVHKDDGAKIVKKRRKDGPSASKKPEVQPLTEVKAEPAGSSDGEKTAAETPPATISGPGYSLIMNGQASSGDGKSSVRETLAQYSKKPYMRVPPTAYLDEKYITMPKRRKEMLFFQPSQRSAAPEQACVTTALQRQRCANCFATFNTAEELQGHLQLQKCSNLFGFDSDDEGNS